ncbi:MAG TPA: glycosyltransferase [Polyangium sp.]|nr:glycosyltransferase [Polyangium sp.]
MSVSESLSSSASGVRQNQTSAGGVSRGREILARSKSILLSADFRDGKGGISRVARTLDEVVGFSSVISYDGETSERDVRIKFCGGNRALFVARALPRLHLGPPDLIFCDHADVSVVPALLAHKKSRLIIFLHDEEAWGPFTRKRKIGLSRASLLLCNSEYTRRRFLARHPEFEAITRSCLLGGVPKAFGSVKHSGPLDPWLLDPRPFALFVSRLWREHRYKGHLELIEAFARLRDVAGPRLRLAIVGSGNDVPTIEERIKAHGLGDHVRVFTGVDDGLLQEFYKKSLFFILPSVREGFGLVFLEAMSCGKPCVAIRNQPAEEIIEQGISGYLLDDNSAETIAAALAPIQRDPEKMRLMADGAKLRYDTHFTREAFRSRFERALEGLP